MKFLFTIKKILIAIGYPIISLLKKQKKKKKSGKNKIKKRNSNILFLFFSVIFFGLTIFIIIFYFVFVKKLPNVNLIYEPPNLSTKIYDRNGNLLYKFYTNEDRTWVSLNKIPESLIHATIAIEDKNFYKHHGISITGIISAVIDNRTKDNNHFRGGSTITQQLVKNVFFDRSKTFERKIKEAILAIQIEGKLSKNEILERYLNQVAYGGETYGVQEASLRYFGKNVWEINSAEATFLAGLPAAPSSYSPFNGNIDYAYQRQKRVLIEMTNIGYLSKEKAHEIEQQKITIVSDKRRIIAPHFVFYVKKYVETKYGFNNIERLGLRINTSLDLDLQKDAEKILEDELDGIKRLNISNGAALVINTKNGDILAMIGSKDYYDNKIDGRVNITTSLRQPGSSIKPINYLLALMKGKTLLSRIDDSPVTYEIKGQKPYSPQNYTGKYMGNVTLKTALASSLNIPSVKLLNENGVKNMIDLAKKMGITTWGDESNYGLSLSLGSAEVKMIDMVQAYSIFSNLGESVMIDPILNIENYLGEKIFVKEIKKERVFEPEYAYLINETLSDDNARAPIFGLNSKLKINNKKVAVKTGTTNNLKDNWCIGWTPTYLVSTWVGNNNGEPMSHVASGVSGATPIWQKIMKNIIDNKDTELWNEPEKIIKKTVCGKEEFFIKGTEDSIKCQSAPTPTPF